MAVKVKTGTVRFSYAHLFEPHAIQEGGEKTYSVMGLIRKDETQTINALKAAYKQAAEEGKEKFGKAFKATPFIRPEGATRGLLIDADDHSKYKDNPDFKGCYLLNAKSKKAPGVLAKETGRKMLTAEDGADIVYSGCYGRMAVALFAYNNMGTGIGVGLNNVLKTKDGERLDGSTSALDDFAEDLDEEDELDDLL